MEEKEAYKFCPKCAGSLIDHPDYNDHLKCSACDFDFFLNAKPCVSAIIMKDDTVLLTKRNVEPHKNAWEPPGGFIDKQEIAEEALKREMKEELGIDITNSRFLFSIENKYPIKGILYNVLVLYFTCDYSGDISLNDESTEYRFFELAQLPDNFHTPHKKALELLKKSLN